MICLYGLLETSQTHLPNLTLLKKKPEMTSLIWSVRECRPYRRIEKQNSHRTHISVFPYYYFVFLQ